MKISHTFLAIIFLLLFADINAQVIPDSLRTDWSQAGYQGVIPEPALIINVKDFGAYGDSMHDDYNAIMNAVNSSQNPRVIFFPSGKYLIKSTVAVPENVIFRGEGETSNLRFDLSAYQISTDCISIGKSQNTNYTNITNGYIKGSTTISVKDGSRLVINGYAEIKENSGDWDPDSNSSYVGQMVKITGINSKVINFTPALRINYAESLQPKIRPVSMAGNVGMECFKITRSDPPDSIRSGRNIVFQYADNCWVTGVESEYCQSVHIAFISCAHITVSGCQGKRIIRK